MRWHRAGRIIAVILLLVLVIGVGGFFAFRYLGIDAAREMVVQRLEAITGREVAIEGDFDLVPSLTPTLAADGIVVANAAWASDEPMLDAERIEVAFELLPLLLQGDLLVDQLTISGADVLFETGAEDRANWHFDAARPEAAEGAARPGAAEGADREFLLNEVTVQDSLVRWRDLESKEIQMLVIDRFAWQAPAATSAVELTGSGKIDGQPLAVSGQLGPLADLLAAAGSYPVLLEATSGQTSARIEGDVDLAADDLELQVGVTGEQFAQLGDVVGAGMPELGAFEFQGVLTGSMEAPALVDVRGTIGAEGAPRLSIADGAITDILSGEGILAELEAEGQELAQLAAAFGVEIAPFGPYAASGTLEGSFESLALRSAEATAGDEVTRVVATGAIANLLELSEIELDATVQGSDLAGLSPLVGFALPPSEPYRIAGHITGSAERLQLDDLEAEVAETRLSGWLVAPLEAAPPRVEGELIAEHLDVDRLLALADGEEPTDSVEQVEAIEAGTGLFTEEPLALAWLDDFEAELAVRADRLLLDQIAFENAALSLTLHNGRLSVQDLVLEVAGGSIAGGAALEARDDAEFAEVSVRLNARDVDVRRLLADWAATERVGGEIDVDINVDATGRSLDELMASLEGSAVAVAEEGEVQEAPLDLLVADLDILRALPPFWRRGDDDVIINCLITEMDIEGGVARTEAMLDTRRMTLLGQGTVDLGEEQLDLVLRPKAKRKKLSKLAVPVDITGSLAEPEVQPRTGTAVGQAVRGVLGGLLIPLNQLSALFGKETVDACKQALEQAGERPDPAPAEDAS